MQGPLRFNAAGARPVTTPGISADAADVTRIGEDRRFRQACKMLPAWERWIQQRQLELSAIAAPTGLEAARAEWMLAQFRQLGLAARVDRVGNVLAASAGAVPSRGVVLISAHLDTAFPAGTRVFARRRGSRLWGPGICDNAAGLAALLVVARWLQVNGGHLRAPVLLVANVGEEGEGDLKGMRYLFRPQGRWARHIAWTLVLDGPGVRHITSEALASLRLRLTLEGPGGHSWSDAGRASALQAAVRVGAALLAQIRTEPGELSCNLGFMQGGGAINAIAAAAEIKLDLRARNPERLRGLEQAVRRALATGVEQENAAASSGRVIARLEPIGLRPGGALAPDAPLLRIIRQVDAALGIPSQLQCASTDANIPLAQGRQAVRLGAGGQAGGIHTTGEWYDPSGRAQALQRILWTLASLAGWRDAADVVRLQRAV